MPMSCSLSPVLGERARGARVRGRSREGRRSTHHDSPLTLTLSPEYEGEGTRTARPYIPSFPDAKYASIPFSKSYFGSYIKTAREWLKSASVHVWKNEYGFSKYSGGKAVFSTRLRC